MNIFTQWMYSDEEPVIDRLYRVRAEYRELRDQAQTNTFYYYCINIVDMADLFIRREGLLAEERIFRGTEYGDKVRQEIDSFNNSLRNLDSRTQEQWRDMQQYGLQK